MPTELYLVGKPIVRPAPITFFLFKGAPQTVSITPNEMEIKFKQLIQSPVLAFEKLIDAKKTSRLLHGERTIPVIYAVQLKNEFRPQHFLLTSDILIHYNYSSDDNKENIQNELDSMSSLSGCFINPDELCDSTLKQVHYYDPSIKQPQPLNQGTSCTLF